MMHAKDEEEEYKFESDFMSYQMNTQLALNNIKQKSLILENLQSDVKSVVTDI